MKINDSEVVDTFEIETTDKVVYEVHVTASMDVYLGRPDDEVLAWCGKASRKEDAIGMAFNSRKGGVR